MIVTAAHVFRALPSLKIDINFKDVRILMFRKNLWKLHVNSWLIDYLLGKGGYVGLGVSFYL